jgi:methylated-DNA-protein-cysteine methyltransferase-like protein
MNFYEKVYIIVRQIPPGRVTHYGAIARMLGSPRASRAVGYALRNLDDPAVPWQRVIHGSGQIRANAAEDTRSRQAARLRKEGVRVSRDFVVDLETFEWDGLSPAEVAQVLKNAS